LIKSQKSTPERNKKPLKIIPTVKKKFDAYHFFKEEYRLSNAHKSEDEMDKVFKLNYNIKILF
jgi:hypothetical protein